MARAQGDVGRCALVGLSQVRESVFSSLPIRARAGSRDSFVLPDEALRQVVQVGQGSDAWGSSLTATQ